MKEVDWLDELYTVCSPPSIDILKFLWSQDKPVDTHSISTGIHISMEEVYQHLNSLETQGLVKMKRAKTKNGDRRLWDTTLDKFTILIKAENGDFTYKSNIKQKSLKILNTIIDKPSKKELNQKTEINAPVSTKIKIKHKGANIELEGSETFVEKRWKEFKPYVNQSSMTIKKRSSAKSNPVKQKKRS